MNETNQSTPVPGGTLRIERRQGGVALLVMDVPNAPVNTLRRSFADEFEEAFDRLEAEESVRAVVFTSGKPDGFIAGADVKMLDSVQTSSEAEGLSRQGQLALDRIARFDKPVVVAIHGACLGGGLEVALACQYRVASSHERTRLGLPEVQLGLIPGAGGTQRLPRLIGVQAALDLMLTGKQIRAKKALDLGLVDEVVPAALLEQIACERARSLAEGEAVRRRPSLASRLTDRDTLLRLALEKNPLGRRVLFDRARAQVLGQTRGNYPAPEAILRAVRVGLEHGEDVGLEAEAVEFGRLVVSPEADAMMHLFLASRARSELVNGEGDAAPRDVSRVGVLGAGLMGAGIAYVTAARTDATVRLCDRNEAALAKGLSSIRSLVDGQVRRRRMSEVEADRLMARITPTPKASGLRHCEIVVEAVFEDLELKRKLLSEVEAQGGDDVIFASNTSSLPISKIAEASAHPETVVGMHYFSPVHRMPLLEVVTTDRTAEWVTATAVRLGQAQGKTVIVVRDGAGFYTTRVLAPLMSEAAHVLSEGVPVEVVDEALLELGFPVGPLKLTDEVGIDVGAHVGRVLVEAFGMRMAPPDGMARLVADGRQGRKNGKGFYLYGEGGGGVDPSVYDVVGVTPRPGPYSAVARQEIGWRCALAMVAEAVRCFEEGVLRSARDGDIGAVFGLGFPPFFGGPFRLVDQIGAAEVVQRLERLEAHHGKRFEAPALLRAMVRTGHTFHGERRVQPGVLPELRAPGASAQA